jgi:hypothetical protein
MYLIEEKLRMYQGGKYRVGLNLHIEVEDEDLQKIGRTIALVGLSLMVMGFMIWIIDEYVKR